MLPEILKAQSSPKKQVLPIPAKTHHKTHFLPTVLNQKKVSHITTKQPNTSLSSRKNKTDIFETISLLSKPSKLTNLPFDGSSIFISPSKIKSRSNKTSNSLIITTLLPQKITTLLPQLNAQSFLKQPVGITSNFQSSALSVDLKNHNPKTKDLQVIGKTSLTNAVSAKFRPAKPINTDQDLVIKQAT